jgi:hypothetical protein
MKKRKRREAFLYEGDDQWLSFSSGEESCIPIVGEERGNSRFNFPNTENKRHCKFFTNLEEDL